MNTVRIQNAIGAPCCGLRHAARYVRQGRAELIEGTIEAPIVIRMRPQSHQHKSAVNLATQQGYDRIRRMLTIREVQRLPMAMAYKIFR